MAKIFTIGFARKTAEFFFDLLEYKGVKEIIDVRLYNRTQLLGFSKYPDIEFFLRRLSNIDYFHDLEFAPSVELFDCYKKNLIGWDDYEKEFAKLIKDREIDTYIANNYSGKENYCLLCSEVSADYCHRRLVAEKIREVLEDEDIEIVHL